MIVKQANRYDIDTLVDFMRDYAEYSPITELRYRHNEEHVRKLITTVLMGAGVAFIAFKDERPIGFLIAVRTPNIWNPDVKLYQELAFWVDIEYRNGTAGYRLYQAYKEHAEEAMKLGDVQAYTISKMNNSKFNPEHLGFEYLESTYIKQ